MTDELLRELEKYIVAVSQTNVVMMQDIHACVVSATRDIAIATAKQYCRIHGGSRINDTMIEHFSCCIYFGNSEDVDWNWQTLQFNSLLALRYFIDPVMIRRKYSREFAIVEAFEERESIGQVRRILDVKRRYMPERRCYEQVTTIEEISFVDERDIMQAVERGRSQRRPSVEALRSFQAELITISDEDLVRFVDSSESKADEATERNIQINELED